MTHPQPEKPTAREIMEQARQAAQNALDHAEYILGISRSEYVFRGGRVNQECFVNAREARDEAAARLELVKRADQPPT